MKNTKCILLIIGLLGIVASVYNYFHNRDLTNTLISFICGASLIFGYFELKKSEKS